MLYLMTLFVPRIIPALMALPEERQKKFKTLVSQIRVSMDFPIVDIFMEEVK